MNLKFHKRDVLIEMGAVECLPVSQMLSRSLRSLPDHLSACRGDLQRQPAPQRLGFHTVVQHAGDGTQGTGNTFALVQSPKTELPADCSP